ncbi:DUF4058 family protein [Anaerolineales bacterium HSG6]|nr:DUF4058 family protein [Anaerolineales bacterium HSG6]
MQRSPFPGMDPYLEAPWIWKQVHTQLIVEIQKFLAPQLRPNYHIEIEELTHLTVTPPTNGHDNETKVGIPDGIILGKTGYRPSGAGVATAVKPVAIKPLAVELPIPIEMKHRFLRIHRTSDNEVITLIELLSPVNKLNKRGREKYITKRLKTLNYWTSFVEIDLLRAGKPMPMSTDQQSHYRILIRRGWRGSTADVYMFNIPDPIPDFPIPLQEGEAEIAVPLNQILHDLYEVIGYGYRIDYQQNPPTPKLSDEMLAWVQTRTET